MSIVSLISSGSLLLAMPVAAAVGAVTFLSPCCLPLVPGYLAYITGMSGADTGGKRAAATGAAKSPTTAASAVAVVGGGSGTVTVAEVPATGPAGTRRSRMVAGTGLFVLGFSLVFSLTGLTFGGISELLQSHAAGITQVLGA
jgi:cytochrome c-type biogenesis protein